MWPGSFQIFPITGQNHLQGNGGNDLLYGLAGHDILIGGGGGDNFYFAWDYDKDTIRDFQPGIDKIYLSNTLGIFSGSQALLFASSSNGDVVFDFGNGNVLVVEGVSLNQITAFDIVM